MFNGFEIEREAKGNKKKQPGLWKHITICLKARDACIQEHRAL
jgi:hypothetical protein